MDSFNKVNLISQDIVSNLIKDIFGEDLNKSSIEATVLQTIKEYERVKNNDRCNILGSNFFFTFCGFAFLL